jgi:hypothetical protein
MTAAIARCAGADLINMIMLEPSHVIAARGDHAECAALDMALVRTLIAMRRHIDSFGRILPDLVAQGADGHTEHTRGPGPVSVATRKRLQYQLSLDLADG